VVICDWCGVPWRLSQMTLDAAGHLRCPDDQRGRDGVTLSLVNARAAEKRRGPDLGFEGGSYYTKHGTKYFRHRTTRDDIVEPL
jgi:hypothetical protein